MATGRIEDVVVALIFLREAGFRKRRCDRDEQRQKKKEDKPHGEPPKSGTTSGLSLPPCWRSIQGGQALPKRENVPFPSSEYCLASRSEARMASWNYSKRRGWPSRLRVRRESARHAPRNDSTALLLIFALSILPKYVLLGLPDQRWSDP